MQKVLTKMAIGAVSAVVLSSPMPLLAAKDSAKLDVEARLARLERVLDSQGLVDILLKLEELQTEVQRLRGEVEVQNHTLEELKKRQRDLYVDLDRRLLQLERNSPVSSAPAASGAVAATTATATAATTSRKGSGKPTAGSARPGVARDGKKPVPASHSEQQAYQNAFDQLRELRYDKASQSFQKFLKEYPDGRYAHIAQYWLGEANYVQRKYKAAILDYQTLIDTYPGSPKLAEAMLKIGYSEYELKNYPAARYSLERLLKTYPGTTEAGQAQNLLQKIKLKSGK